MKTHEYRAELWLPRPREEVFTFFSEAANLQEITPPWLSFQVVSPQPVEMRPGARIDYRLRVHGFPLRWQSEITEWQPPERFVDEQRRGPYRLWHHQHEFHERDGGTLCTDHVQYAVAFDFLVHRLFVRRDLERIFAYRRQKLEERFGARQHPGR